MITCNCIGKFRNRNNVIYKYRLVDIYGNIQDIDPIQLKNAIASQSLRVLNLRLTSDGRLIDVLPANMNKKQRAFSRLDKETKEAYNNVVNLVCKHLEFPRGRNKLNILDNGITTFITGERIIHGEKYRLYIELEVGTTITLFSDSMCISGTGLDYKEQVALIKTVMANLQRRLRH